MMYMWAQVGIPVSHFSQDILHAGTQIPWNQKEAGDMIGYSGHITRLHRHVRRHRLHARSPPIR